MLRRAHCVSSWLSVSLVAKSARDSPNARGITAGAKTQHGPLLTCAIQDAGQEAEVWISADSEAIGKCKNTSMCALQPTDDQMMVLRPSLTPLHHCLAWLFGHVKILKGGNFATQ